MIKYYVIHQFMVCEALKTFTSFALMTLLYIPLSFPRGPFLGQIYVSQIEDHVAFTEDRLGPSREERCRR